MAVSENALRFNELNIVGKVVSQPVTEDDGITTFQLYQESSSLSIRVVVFEPNSIQLGETLIVKGKLAYDVQGQELAMGASTIFTVEGVPLKHVPSPAPTLHVPEEEKVSVAIEVQDAPSLVADQEQSKVIEEEENVSPSVNPEPVVEEEPKVEEPVIEVGLPPLSGDTPKVKEEIVVPSVEETTLISNEDSEPEVEQPAPVQPVSTFKTILKVSNSVPNNSSPEPVKEVPVPEPVKEEPKKADTVEPTPVVEKEQPKVETPQPKPVEKEPAKKEEVKEEVSNSQDQSSRPSRFSVSDFNC